MSPFPLTPKVKQFFLLFEIGHYDSCVKKQSSVDFINGTYEREETIIYTHREIFIFYGVFFHRDKDFYTVQTIYSIPLH